MNKSLVFSLLGRILLLEAAVMMIPLGVSLIYGGEDALPFVYSILLAAGVGLLLWRVRPRDDNLRPREGYVTVALSWVALSVFGAMPFYFSGYIPSLVDCLFETASGFTTTGSTILTDVEALPRGILFWRSLTHWVGGMGVLVLGLAVLPKMGARSLNLLKAESPGPTPGKLVPRIAATARILYRLYLGLTLLQVVALLFCGMNLYDALIHTFGSAGTGGFSNYNLSVGHFDSAAIDAVIGVFMLLFSLNFTLYYLLLHRNFKLVVKNEELRNFLIIVAASVLIIALNILPRHKDFWQALRYSFFQVSSIISTSGFSTEDFNLWPELSRTLLVLLMLIGACAGSTGGGLKVIRIQILVKSAWREIKRVLNPRAVHVVKSEGRAMEEMIVSQVLMFAFVYMLLIAVATLLLSLDNYSTETNFTAVVSAISNIGPGLGMTGPMGSFAGFSIRSKLILTFCMLAGRLEIYPMLMLFTVGAWKKN